MRERGMIFNAEMVRAILEGTKTQTRRIMQDQPDAIPKEGEFGRPGFWIPWNAGKTMLRNEDMRLACPFGAVGDRLWVRETWQAIHDSPDEHGNVEDRTWMPSILKKPDSYWHPVYAASWGNEDRETRGFPWRPSLHMPRWASRITLEITGVRVERLQNLSEADACAEGIRAGIRRTDQSAVNEPIYCNYLAANLNDASEWFERASDSFISLWESIYGAESWQHSPWVWVIEFKRVEDDA